MEIQLIPSMVFPHRSTDVSSVVFKIDSWGPEPFALVTGFLTNIKEIVQSVKGCDSEHHARDAGRQPVFTSVCGRTWTHLLHICATETGWALGGSSQQVSRSTQPNWHLVCSVTHHVGCFSQDRRHHYLAQAKNSPYVRIQLYVLFSTLLIVLSSKKILVFISVTPIYG